MKNKPMKERVPKGGPGESIAISSAFVTDKYETKRQCYHG
jgi:hypothetical protein